MDDCGHVQWKQGYQTHALRCRFARQMFGKVFDILSVEDGMLFSACKSEGVIDRVVRQAEMLGRQHVCVHTMSEA